LPVVALRAAGEVRSSCHRQAEAEQQQEAPSPASQQGQAVAWRRPAGVAAAREVAPLSAMKAAVGAELVRSAASARQVRPSAVEVEVAAVPFGQEALRSAAAVASDVKVRPPEEAVSGEPDVAGLLPVEEAVAPDAVAEPQQAAVAEVPDAAAVRRPAAVAVPGAVVLQPAAAVLPAPWGRQPVERPSALLWVCHPDPGPSLPWPAPRRAVRFARATRRSRVASPSMRLRRAARCEGLSWYPWVRGKGLVATGSLSLNLSVGRSTANH
jgi:hypothetical protein